MTEAAANADYDELHKEAPWHDGTFTKWAKDRDAAHPYGARDGVTITVSEHDLTPDDDFLKQEGR